MTTTEIVCCLNRGLMRPLVTLINSVQAHATRPDALRFNLIVPPRPEDLDAFERLIEAAFPERRFEIRIVGGDLSPPVWEYLQARSRLPAKKEGAQTMNYARFEVARLFPGLGRFIYLDCDIVVLADLEDLVRDFDPSRRLAAVPQLFTGLFYFRKPWAHWKAGLSMLRPFNAGVYVSDAAAWGEDLARELQSIFDWDSRNAYRLFSLHTEPLMNLLFKDYAPLHRRWNASGFGNHPVVAAALKRWQTDIGIVHWSGGHRKPWRDRTIAFADEWWRYDLGPVPKEVLSPYQTSP
ncbi:MAG: glycosyltransferase [Pseudomonadota bacterium]